MIPVKARYENNVLKPLEKLDLVEGDEVEIEIVKSNADRIVGLLKDIDIDSVDLQHAARDIWVRKIVSDSTSFWRQCLNEDIRMIARPCSE